MNALDGDKEAMRQFTVLSGRLRNGDCTTDEYVDVFVALFGHSRQCDVLFNDLLTLLPDPMKVKMLKAVWMTKRRSAPGFRKK